MSGGPTLVARAFGLLRAPDATWSAIAAEGDTRRWLFRAYLPALALLPWAIGALLGLPEGLTSRTEQTMQVQPGAGGVVGTGVTMTLSPTVSALLMMPVALLFALLAALLMRDMVLQAVPRHGAVNDPVAATKLAIYGQTGFWLGSLLAFVPHVGGIGWLVGVGYGLWLLRRGATRLLPPAPGREAALRRTVLLRAVLASVAAGLVVTVAAGAVAIALLIGLGLGDSVRPSLPGVTIET